MRIVVISDVHSDRKKLRDVCERELPLADKVFFLGDGGGCEDLIEEYFDDKAIMVRGNCDRVSIYPIDQLVELRGKRIFACHGHTYNAKYGIETLKNAARAKGADIVLYGHTHRALEQYEDGLYVLNPGSLCRSSNLPSYGIIDISPSGIMTSIVQVK